MVNHPDSLLPWDDRLGGAGRAVGIFSSEVLTQPPLVHPRRKSAEAQCR